MKRILILLLISALARLETDAQSKPQNLTTVCNPVNISYRFGLDHPSRREAADPVVLWYKDRYFLFASKSGGYWYSKDLSAWTFIETDQIPTEDYAPTAVVIRDSIYLIASSSNTNATIYKATDILNGKWSAAKVFDFKVWDPDLFLDDDGRLYLYWGCSDVRPTLGMELDLKNNFAPIGLPKELVQSDPNRYGWQVLGDFNSDYQKKPWIEGSWMNKYHGLYYLQFAIPGTQFKSYADGVCTSKSPLGPFVYQRHNPLSYKPEGYTSGAGHGSTFADQYGNYWHISTITISQKHMFERRLGIYPTFFDQQGTMYCLTKFGDYPMIIPRKKIKSFSEIFPGWMLLSYNKKVKVSSSDIFPSSNLTDEDIRTYWAAKTGNAGEYAIVDLAQLSDVYAIQINFPEHKTAIYGRQKNISYQYTVEQSSDNKHWTVLSDKSKNDLDNSHDYIQLEKKVRCRYIKITNLKTSGGNFALSGLRVFGKGPGKLPFKINGFSVTRDEHEKRSANLLWKKVNNAVGYNISFGVDKDKLYENYTVYGKTSVRINSLDARQRYYFSIQAFNENGISAGKTVLSAE